MPSPELQLDTFIARFTPEVALHAHESLAKMRERLPGAVELVYDNYNALAIGFGPTERTSDIIFSIAVYPRWVSLFFARGIDLADPDQLLKGSGNVVRHIILKDPVMLDSPGVRALMAQALARAGDPIDPSAGNRIIVKSVSPKQRPRRPAVTGPAPGSIKAERDSSER